MLSAQHSTQQQQQIQHFQQQLQYQKQQQQQLDALRLQPPSSQSFEDLDDTLSLSSSPNSAQLSPAVFSAGFDPDFALDQDDYSFSILGSSGSSDLNMQTEPWLQQLSATASQTATGRSLGRFTSHHHRESSLSSLGSVSAGPASPFSQNTSNPHIAVTDPSGDGYSNMPTYYEDASSNYQLSKPLAAAAADAAGSHDFYPPGIGHAAATTNCAHPQSPHPFGGLLSTPSRPAGSDRVGAGLLSQPVSVASSIASNSPATPSLDQLQPDEEVRRRNGNAAAAFPKYDPYHNDDLQSSTYGIAPTSTASPSSQDMFSQRLQAMNTHNQHLRHSAALANAVRERSPFRQNSPLAPSPLQDFGSPGALRFATRQQQQQQQQPPAVQQHQHQPPQQHQQHSQHQSQPPRHQLATTQASGAPQTISPKDSVLEYHDVDAETDPSNFSLFAQTNPHASSMAGQYPGMSAPNFSFLPQLTTPGMSQMTQPPAYPYVAQPPPQSQPHTSTSAQAVTSTSTSSPAGPPRVLTTEVPMNRPYGIAADGGTYTCTYHGCTLRFETPALLQKHKREGHRQAHALAGGRRGVATGVVESGASAGGATSALLLQNTQAGPHRCERINPSTGKPCNTVFSRPYDLTRHEDTIHNARKQKVRCALCTEEKTFSRADALTRHFRVCHPDVELRGKQRKRMTSA